MKTSEFQHSTNSIQFFEKRIVFKGETFTPDTNGDGFIDTKEAQLAREINKRKLQLKENINIDLKFLHGFVIDKNDRNFLTNNNDTENINDDRSILLSDVFTSTQSNLKHLKKSITSPPQKTHPSISLKSQLYKIIEMPTQSGYTFTFTNLNKYTPITTPNKIEIADEKVKNLITKNNTGLIFDKNGSADNIENTDPKEIQAWLLKYLNKKSQLLANLNISDIKNITPQQAIKLSAKIVTERLDYDHDQVTLWGNIKSLFGGNDKKSVISLLEDGKGICRNYSHAVYTIFNALKSLQNPTTNLLNNTYCTLSVDSKNNELFPGTTNSILRDNIVKKHMWNTFYTITPSGEINSTVIDTISSDHGGMLDTSKSFFLFNLEQMVKQNVITRKEEIKTLKTWVNENRNKYSKEAKIARLLIKKYDS